MLDAKKLLKDKTPDTVIDDSCNDFYENLYSEFKPIKHPKISKTLILTKNLFFNKMFIIPVGLLFFSLILVLYSSTISQETSSYIPTKDSDILIPQKDIETTDEKENLFTDFVVGIEDPEYEEVAVAVQYEPETICFIGNSRVTDMMNAVYTDANFIICAEDEDWINIIQEQLITMPDIKICVIVLELDNMKDKILMADRLLNFQNNNSDKICVCVNVGPINEDIVTDIKNIDIEDFNQYVESTISEKYQLIDQYEYLTADGFTTTETGVNYINTINAKIFCWIMDNASIQTETKIIEKEKESNEQDY